MDHLIRFTTAEGVDGSHVAASLDDAISFVEHLRNVEGAGDVRLYRLTEVPIEFRTYYRVEVGATAPAAPLGSPPLATSSPASPASVQLGAHPEAEQTADHEVGPPELPVVAGAADVDPGLAYDSMESAAANSRRLFSRG